MPKAGIVTVVGKPNAGKSTLLNRVIREKLSTVSSKPQSTRNKIVGIHTSGDTQIILLDTPGLISPRYALQESMRGVALSALREADVVLYLIDGTEGSIPELGNVAQLDRPVRAPVVVAINKADVLTPGQRESLTEQAPDALFVSAITG